ncbi:unnamed protein product [Trichobilharzia regenti]|nr:unnamed protein product [Trichobilharzia regenti]
MEIAANVENIMKNGLKEIKSSERCKFCSSFAYFFLKNMVDLTSSIYLLLLLLSLSVPSRTVGLQRFIFISLCSMYVCVVFCFNCLHDCP